MPRKLTPAYVKHYINAPNPKKRDIQYITPCMFQGMRVLRTGEQITNADKFLDKTTLEWDSVYYKRPRWIGKIYHPAKMKTIVIRAFRFKTTME